VKSLHGLLDCEIGGLDYVITTEYRTIDQTLVNSLHGLLDCEIGGLDYVITTEYRTCVH